MKNKLFVLSILCLSLVVLMTCKKSSPTTPEQPTTPDPVITSFTATPETIAKGDSSILEWKTSNATSVSINQGIGTVNKSGTKLVYPDSTITYTLTATNSIGVKTATCTLTVKLNPPIIVSFAASPNEIWYTQSFTLSWEVTGADTIEIDQEIGNVSAKDSKEITPSLEMADIFRPVIFTLTAKNSVGTVTAISDVRVKQTIRIIMWGEPEATKDNSGVFQGYRGEVKNIGNKRAGYYDNARVIIFLHDSNGIRLAQKQTSRIWGSSISPDTIRDWNITWAPAAINDWGKRVDTTKTKFEIRYDGCERFE